MSIFVSKEKVPVTLDGINVIYIRSKMSVGVANKVNDALIKVGTFNGNQAEDVSVLVGEQQSVLLVNNILSWEGPQFRDEVTNLPIPCIPENILNMDPDEPLVDKTLAEIGRVNKKREIIPNQESPSETPKPAGKPNSKENTPTG